MNEPKKYRKSFLVYRKDQILPIAVNDIAFFYLENQMVFCFTRENEKFIIDQALDKISQQLNPEDFFRANRQFIVSRKAIKAAVHHLNRKLKLSISPSPKEDIVIGKTKVTAFKEWLER
ncbi:MAG: LytTR family transcriptional regulator DNA-binding domain-containing protein [Bacteroidales bacterium]|nr:LytTR family transcriptional regulator DNA-binding domain-containing protein [Bacteroidales bacterium]